MMEMAVAVAARREPWAEEARATLALGWPLVLTNLAQIAIHTTDVLMMGWLGPDALAAGALGTNCYFMMFVFGLGIALATQPMLAQERGRKRFGVRELRRTVRQGFWAGLAAVIPIWAVLWNAERILLAIGQEPALASEAGAYIRTLQWGLLPFFWFNVLRSFVNALERPRPALVVGLLAIPVNALLAWSLMFGEMGMPALGLVGAGIASSIANTVMFVALLAFVLGERRLRRYRVLGHFWRSDWPRFRSLLQLGLPIGITLMLETAVFNVAAFLQGLLGRESLAAHAVALQLCALTFMVPLGLAQAATVRVGFAAGRGDREGVRRAGWTAFALGTVFMSGAGLLLVAAPETLVGLFLDRTDPANAGVFVLAAGFLVIGGLFQVADGLQAIGGGVLRGLKDTRVPMAIAAFGYWVAGLPVGALLAFQAKFGGYGIWIGFVTGLSTVAALLLLRWSRRDELGLVGQPRSEVALQPCGA